MHECLSAPTFFFFPSTVVGTAPISATLRLIGIGIVGTLRPRIKGKAVPFVRQTPRRDSSCATKRRRRKRKPPNTMIQKSRRSLFLSPRTDSPGRNRLSRYSLVSGYGKTVPDRFTSQDALASLRLKSLRLFPIQNKKK